ncbi:hypothetical protein BU17DRAFT_88419 [Hysterangium stoloniferum]|nr:hypothetical protein BU17DRAFT_88419 [Hysterangium stoloniferum]
MLKIHLTTIVAPSELDGSEPDERAQSHRSSLLSDFGIIAGSAEVPPDDQLAYGQEHFWIYSKTAKGEMAYLKCNMFTFDLTIQAQVSGGGYISSEALGRRRAVTTEERRYLIDALRYGLFLVGEALFDDNRRRFPEEPAQSLDSDP